MTAAVDNPVFARVYVSLSARNETPCSSASARG
jgi:hypothetical protein